MNRVIEVVRRGKRGIDGTHGLSVVQVLAGNFTATSDYLGYAFYCTPASMTLALETAPSLGNGWHCIVDSAGGNVTVNPFGPQTINGALSLVIPQNYSAFIFTDGSNFFARFFVSNPSILTSFSVGSAKLQKQYESPATAIAASGTFSFTHALGVQPKLLMPVVRCKANFAPYVVGDESMILGSTFDVLAACYSDSVTIDGAWTAGVSVDLAANFDLIVRAWA